MKEALRLSEDLIASETVTFLIGNGSSMSGYLNDDEKFPCFTEIISRVLNASGYFKSDINESSDILFHKFASYLNQYKRNASHYLRTFIDGEPGSVHFHFMSLIYSFIIKDLSPNKKFLIITTNYDQIIEKSLKCLNIEYGSFSLEKEKDISIELLQQINLSLIKKKPTIIHLYGNLNGEEPLFFQEDLCFTKKNFDIINKYFRNLVISIGYSFSDQEVVKLVFQNNMTAPPVYNVSPIQIRKSFIINHVREIINVNNLFSDFAIELLNKIYEKSPVFVGDKRAKHFGKIIENYEERILPLDLLKKYDFNFIQWRIKIINKISIASMEKGITPDSVLSFEDLYVERKIIDWEDFCEKDKRNIALILGDAGTGKSTQLLMTAKSKPKSNIIPLLIKPTSIKREGLTRYLENIFMCQTNTLETFLIQLSDTFKLNNNYLLILIDAINELGKLAINTKCEIEDLFSLRWPNIKVVYSCRSYFYDTYMEPRDFDPNKYYPIKDITKFNDKELILAFDKYKKCFNLHGNIEKASVDFRNKLRDPLMLRLMSEAYVGSSIPEFAPAVKIFEAYFNLLSKRFNGQYRTDFQTEMLKLSRAYWELKTEDVIGTMGAPILKLEYVDSTLLEYLKENNVIIYEEGYIKYSYERFFEFTLGLYLSHSKKWFFRAKKIKSSDVFYIWKSLVDSNRPYTYLFSLKSSLVKLFVDSHKTKSNNLTNERFIDSLLKINKVISGVKVETSNQFRTYIYDVLREAVSELDSSRREIDQVDERTLMYIHLANSLTTDFHTTLLKIAQDDYRSIPFQIELLASPKIEIKRKVLFNLLYMVNDPAHLRIIRDSCLSKLNGSDKHCIEGLIYILPIMIKHYRLVFSTFKKSAAEFYIELVSDITENFSNNVLRLNYKNTYLECLEGVYKNEGLSFFGRTKQITEGINYAWSMNKKEKDNAYVLAHIFATSNQLRIPESQYETIRFFASQIEKIKDINKNFESFDSVQKMRSWEYFMTKYIILQQSVVDFQNVITIFDYLIAHNVWLTFDFCMVTMESILRGIHTHDDEKCELGIKKMYEWTEIAEYQYPNFFFSRLNVDDPLNYSFNPLSPLANTLISKYPDKGFDYLNKRITSGDIKQAKLAILSIRKVSRRFPEAGLESFKIAWNQVDLYDEEYRIWLKTFLKELSFTNPKMIYDFYTSVQISSKQREEIESLKASPVTTEYNINSFFEYILHDNWFNSRVLEIYQEMLSSDNINTFFRNTIRPLFK